MPTFIFFRHNEKGEEFFYPVEEELQERILGHVKLNPGTVRVEDIEGNVIWKPEVH